MGYQQGPDQQHQWPSSTQTSPSHGSRTFLEFRDDFQKLVRATEWSQRGRMYRSPPPPPPPPPRRPPTPEENHTDFASRMMRVLEIEKEKPFKPKINKDYWARKDTAIQSLHYQPRKNMKPKTRDIFATCQPYIPLVLPDEAHEPECDATCDTWDRAAKPPFLARLRTVRSLIGHHTFDKSFYVNKSELLGKDPSGSKVFRCKRIRPGLPQVTLDARRRFVKPKDLIHPVPVIYAVKIVDKNDPMTDSFRLYVEVICLTILLKGHRNVVQCKEVYESEDEIYVVMELCSGPGGPLTLHDFFPAAENRTAQQVFQQLVDVVTFMHSRGVVHNALSPDNVMFLDDYGRDVMPTVSGSLDVTDSKTTPWKLNYFSSVKIIDFNRAVYDPNLGQGYNPVFLPDDYFTPEQLMVCKADPQNDIRALGRILLAILVGRMPTLNEYYPYRAREDHPEYEYRGKFDPRMVDLYERIFLALQGEPDYPPTLEKIRQHPWVSERYIHRDVTVREEPVMSAGYMDCEMYLRKSCFPGCPHHHVRNYPDPCQHVPQS